MQEQIWEFYRDGVTGQTILDWLDGEVMAWKFTRAGRRKIDKRGS